MSLVRFLLFSSREPDLTADKNIGVIVVYSRCGLSLAACVTVDTWTQWRLPLKRDGAQSRYNLERLMMILFRHMHDESSGTRTWREPVLLQTMVTLYHVDQEKELPCGPLFGPIGLPASGYGAAMREHSP